MASAVKNTSISSTERLAKLIYSGQLDSKEIDRKSYINIGKERRIKSQAPQFLRFAAVVMAELAAEGLKYDNLANLQICSLFRPSSSQVHKQKPTKNQQRAAANLTRWAVLYSASLLKNNKTIHEALMAATMQLFMNAFKPLRQLPRQLTALWFLQIQ